MNFQARVSLFLNKITRQLILTYYTYEKATYDQFIATSISLHSNNEKQAYTYIDDITGKGSLNKYFKSLVSEILQMTEEDKKKIIKTSQYPIKKKDESTRYVYYPDLNISILNDEYYEGDLLGYSLVEMKKILQFEENLIDCKKGFEKIQEQADIYELKFTDETTPIQISLTKRKKWIPFSKELFEKTYKVEQLDLYDYPGMIGIEASGEDWNIVPKGYFASVKNNDKKYLDDENNVCVYSENCIKKIEIAKCFSLVLYKETRFEFVPQHKRRCEELLNHLLTSNKINEFKTKALVQLLKAVDPNLAQNAINYILERKDSKEISLVGIALIHQEIVDGWSDYALNRMKQVQFTAANKIYEINPNLIYTIDELRSVDATKLTAKDKKRLEEAIKNRKNMIDTIHNHIGEIADTDIRDKIKKMSQTPEIIKFGQKIKNWIAHSKGKVYENMTDSQFQQVYEECSQFYLEFKKIYAEAEKKGL